MKYQKRLQAKKDRFIANIRAKVPLMPLDEVLAAGVAYAAERGFPDGRAAKDKPDMAAVNYLRHVKSNYHLLLNSAPTSRNGTGRFGTDNGVYKAIRTSILDEIARLYPDLADAVERQKNGEYLVRRLNEGVTRSIP